MAANSTQGQGVLVFLLAFLFLGCGLFGEGVLYYLLFLVGAAASVALFLKAKAAERME